MISVQPSVVWMTNICMKDRKKLSKLIKSCYGELLILPQRYAVGQSVFVAQKASSIP